MGLTSRSNSTGGGLPGGCRGDLLVSLSICTELVGLIKGYTLCGSRDLTGQ
jgi:hypothetical protein